MDDDRIDKLADALAQRFHHATTVHVWQERERSAMRMFYGDRWHVEHNADRWEDTFRFSVVRHGRTLACYTASSIEEMEKRVADPAELPTRIG